MEELDHDLLISCSSGLGSWLEDANGSLVYCKTDDCIECLKDLQRFLRRDHHDKRPAFFTLSKGNIAKSDLVPLLSAYPDNKEVVFNAVKVATFLTMPVDIETEAVDQQLDCQRQVKEVFINQDALAIVVALAAEPLSKSARMNEQDSQLVQLVITFVRNLLCIEDRTATAGSRGDHKSRMGGDLLNGLFDQHVMELLLLIAQHTARGQLKSEAALLLEVFSRIFHKVEAKELLFAKQLQSNNITGSRALQSKASMVEVHSLFAKEKESLRAMKGPPRHPRYGGTFTSYNQHNPNSITLMRNNPNRTRLPALATQKPKTKLIASDLIEVKTRSSVMIRLRAYLEQLLEGSYELLMATVRKMLEPGMGISRLGREDFMRFLAFSKLCTSFVRQKQESLLREKRRANKENQNTVASPLGATAEEETSPFAAISATMGWETFYMVQTMWLSVIDQNPKTKDWEVQNSSLSLFKEMLLTLDLAQQIGSSSDKIAADRLSRRLLHDDQKDSGLLPVLSRMLKNFSFRYQPRSHAAEIVEALHITLRLLERLSQKEAGAFMVKRKAAARKQRTQKAKQRAEPQEEKPGDADGNDDSQNDDNDKHPAEVNEADQLPASNVEEAEAGGQAELEKSEQQARSGSGDAEAQAGEEEAAQESTRDPFDELEEEEEVQRRTKEVAYNLNQRIQQELAFPSVVHIYTWLLHGFKTNSAFLNHGIVSFLRRVASREGLNLEPMLFQLSVMRVFSQILTDKPFRGQPHSAELVRFCTEISRSLFARLVPEQASAGRDGTAAGSGGRGNGGGEHAESTAQAVTDQEAKLQHNLSSMMYIELLFWKNQRESEDVRDEYNWRRVYGQEEENDRQHDLTNRSSRPQARQAISSAQEQQLRELFEKHGMEKGHLDLIVSHMGAGLSRTRVAQELRALNLKRGVLTQPQEEQMRHLYSKHKRQRGYLQLIADDMPGAFKKSQIKTHLRKLGLKLQGRKASAFSSDSEKGSDKGKKSSDESDSDMSGVEQASEADRAKHSASAQPALVLKRQPLAKRARKMADWSDDDSDGNTNARPVAAPDASAPIEPNNSPDTSMEDADDEEAAMKDSSRHKAESAKILHPETAGPSEGGKGEAEQSDSDISENEPPRSSESG